MIRRLEELSSNAWPGLSSVYTDGWIARFAHGFYGRSNSVLPLYPGATPLPEKIEHCEALFRLQGINPAFKLTAASLPENLDDELDRRGYLRQATTSVMTLETLSSSASQLPLGYSLNVSSTLERPWFNFYAAGLDERKATTARAIMEHIVPSRRFLLLEGADGPAACALTVIEDGWAGIFDVIVREDLRGRGLGRLIMEWTLHEAAKAGAKQSYLQVLQGNEPAEALYRNLGYTLAYPYWYRVKPETH